MNRILALVALSLALAGCDKVGVTGKVNMMMGNWAEVTLPKDCRVRQVTASAQHLIVLCEDGRVFY